MKNHTFCFRAFPSRQALMPSASKVLPIRALPGAQNSLHWTRFRLSGRTVSRCSRPAAISHGLGTGAALRAFGCLPALCVCGLSVQKLNDLERVGTTVIVPATDTHLSLRATSVGTANLPSHLCAVAAQLKHGCLRSIGRAFRNLFISLPLVLLRECVPLSVFASSLFRSRWLNAHLKEGQKKKV